jgi:cyanate permease
MPEARMDTQTLLWLVLAATIGTVLVIDLVIVDRRAHVPTFREAAVASAIYVGLGLLSACWSPSRAGRPTDRRTSRATCSS